MCLLDSVRDRAREREREREREAVLFFLRSVFLASNEAVPLPRFFCNKREVGKARQKIRLFLPPPRHAVCLPHYPLERRIGERHYFKKCFLYRGTMSVNYCAVLLGSCFLTFRRNVPSSSSELRVCINPNLKMKTVRFSERREKLRNHMAQQPKRPCS